MLFITLSEIDANKVETRFTPLTYNGKLLKRLRLGGEERSLNQRSEKPMSSLRMEAGSGTLQRVPGSYSEVSRSNGRRTTFINES